MSNHQVKIVLLSKFDRVCDTIFIGKWEEQVQEPVLRRCHHYREDHYQPNDVPSYWRCTGTAIQAFSYSVARALGGGDVVIDVQELEEDGRK